MNAFDIIRAWKDEAYRASLSAAQLAAMPANPAGMVELNDTDLELVVGGFRVLHDYSDSGSGCGGGTGTGTGTGNGTGGNCTSGGCGNGSTAGIRRLRGGKRR
jgi:mersacidin/lichenicidin family type 2 lantibiotic